MSAIVANAHAMSDPTPGPSSEPATRPAQGDWPSLATAPEWPAPRHPGQAEAAPGRAVVLDEETSSQRQLCSDLVACGWDVDAVHAIADLRPAIVVRDDGPAADLVIAEYRLAGKSVLDLLERVPRALWSRMVIVTAYGSVASAVRAVKLGVGGYLVKPARGADVLHAAGRAAPTPPDELPASYLSLDRAIWEVLNEAVEQAGTVSGAARRLGLHARSLRRMLAKYPPAR
jgi:ActR/RegA family two-component response regulator